ncbi:bacteriohemerythrin [Candidatus Parabeggiatoa sp. HSG14]|uniref:bacteriohemerythrin n=1 Tax=Candidatus Parabeggiatoa sp. HSG14 TaxID=3055593 RepID=UPI0025A91E58|nr:bacteriohemerythrin [Thiotrichales bacterium HSG14]
MALIEWTDDLSVGIEIADIHHKKLVSMINALHNAIIKGYSKKVMENILSALSVYTQKHFEYEEKLFETYNYPEYKEHKRQHDNLKKQVLEFNEEFNAGNTMLSIKLLDFLKSWLIQHIVKSDKKYAAFLNEKGVK